MIAESPLICLAAYSNLMSTFLAMVLLKSIPSGIPKSTLAPAPKTIKVRALA